MSSMWNAQRGPSHLAGRGHLRAVMTVALLFIITLAARSAAPLPREVKKIDPRVIAQLLKDLGSDDTDKQNAATEKLKEIGEPALEALRKTEKETDDADVRLRAIVIIRAIQKGNMPEGIVLKGHTSGVVCLDISPDGSLAISGGNDNKTILWDLKGGKMLRQLGNTTEGFIWGVSFSPDGKQVLASTSKGHLNLYNVSNGGLIRSADKRAKAIRDVGFLSDGKRAITINYDTFVRLIDVESMKELKQYTGHKAGQLSLAVSRDGKYAVTGGGNEKEAYVWDVEGGKQQAKLSGHGERILGCAFSPDSKHCVTTSWDNKARIWSVATGKLERTIEAGSKIFGAHFSPDGKTLALGQEKGSISLWDAQSGKALSTLEGHTDAVNKVRFSRDGKMLLSASKDGTIRLWRLQR